MILRSPRTKVLFTCSALTDRRSSTLTSPSLTRTVVVEVEAVEKVVAGEGEEAVVKDAKEDPHVAIVVTDLIVVTVLNVKIVVVIVKIAVVTVGTVELLVAIVEHPVVVAVEALVVVGEEARSSPWTRKPFPPWDKEHSLSHSREDEINSSINS